MKIVKLDVSDLPAPEPLEKVLELLDHTSSDDIVCMIHRHRPCSLFDILKERGFLFKVQESEKNVQIYIWHKDNCRAPETVNTEILK